MLYTRFYKLLIPLACVWAPLAYADITTEGWAWGVVCPPSGTSFTGGNFTSSTSGGFVGGGSCSRTSTRFTQFSFTSSSGPALSSSSLYSVHTGDVLVLPPVLSSETQPVFTVASACPGNNETLNWIFVQWDNNSRTMQNTYVLVAATYDLVAGINVTGQYDVTGALYWGGHDPMPGSCSNGVYTVTTGSDPDLNGTVYFTLRGAGVYKTNPGHATFFFPQYQVSAASDLGSKTMKGMNFDSYISSDARMTQVTSNAAGTTFTVQPYSDPGAGVLDSSGSAFTDTITITSVNSPANGMLVGTVTRTGNCSGPCTGKIACIVDKSINTEVLCSGQSPGNTSYPYTSLFTLEGAEILGEATAYSNVQAQLGLNGPEHAAIYQGRLFVTDPGNNRVLIWNALPTTNQQPPDPAWDKLISTFKLRTPSARPVPYPPIATARASSYPTPAIAEFSFGARFRRQTTKPPISSWASPI